MPRIGNLPLYTRRTPPAAIIKKRQRTTWASRRLNLHVVKHDDGQGRRSPRVLRRLHLCRPRWALLVDTPAGINRPPATLLDAAPGAQSIQETEKIKALGERNVLAPMIDRPRHQAGPPGDRGNPPSSNLDEIIANAQARSSSAPSHP